MSDLFAATESSAWVDLIARATVVLSLSLALQWLIRRGPAATRHHVWTLTFALLLLLPVFRLVGPSLEVPLLRQASFRSEEPRSAAPEQGAFFVAPAETLTALVPNAPASRGTVKAPVPWRGTQLAFVLWGIGCGAAFISVGVGIWRFHQLIRAAQPVKDETWFRQLDALRKQLAIRAEVRLVLGAEAATPMTGGLRRPVILLPASAASWSEARRHVVLAHELVHVRRRDALRQLAGRAVLAFYWFHPLSWVASYLAAARREEACDEGVLAVGARPSDYARHLVSLAEKRAFVRDVLSLPMAQRSRLERRIRAILKPYRARPRAWVTAAALTAVAIVGASASVADPRIRPRSSPDPWSEVAAVVRAGVDCKAASDVDQLSGRMFVPDGGLITCAIDPDVGPDARNGIRALGPAEWAVVESEILRQIGSLDAEGTVAPRGKGSAQPSRQSWAGETLYPVEAEVDARHGVSPR